MQVEDGLLPVGVFGVRTGGEAYGLVACSKVDIEPGDQGVREIVAADSEGERCGESEVGRLNSVKVDGKDEARVRDHCLEVDGIDERLGKSNGLKWGEIKAVYRLPDFNFERKKSGQVSGWTSS